MRVSSRPGLIIFQISGSIFVFRIGEGRFVGESRFREGAGGAVAGRCLIDSNFREDSEKESIIMSVVLPTHRKCFLA